MNTQVVETFKRTVKFSRPTKEVDQFKAVSFVAEFKDVDNATVLEPLFKTAGGARDFDLVKAVLYGASDRSIEEVLSDHYATGATSREYMKALREGIAGKNSET